MFNLRSTSVDGIGEINIWGLIEIANQTGSCFEVLVIFIAMWSWYAQAPRAIQNYPMVHWQQSRWHPYPILDKMSLASRDHRDHDNVHNLSLLLPPSNINLPTPYPFCSSFNFLSLTTISLRLQMLIINRKRKASAGHRSWHHDKDHDEYHSLVSIQFVSPLTEI